MKINISKVKIVISEVKIIIGIIGSAYKIVYCFTGASGAAVSKKK